MAFVTKSPRQPSFPSISNHSQLALHTLIPQEPFLPEYRIHQGMDHSYRRVSDSKNIHIIENNRESKDWYEEEGETTNNTIKNESAIKNTYNFKNVKKSKFEAKIMKPTDYVEVEAQEYYDLPSCISKKTMVKYVQSCPSLLAKTKVSSLPGPGAYNPKLPLNVKSPAFKNSSSCETNNILNQNQILKEKKNEETKEEKEEDLFAVKYKTMNSSSFKKSPNLLNDSNKTLMRKILKKSMSNMATEISLESEDEYVKIENYSPSPFTYKENKSFANKNSNLFSKERRFHTNLPDGSNKFYNSSANQKDEASETHNFRSSVERFESKSQEFCPSLQYTSYENSLLLGTKNRFEIGFDSTVDRKNNHSIDSLPFYNVKTIDKNQLVTKFIESEKERTIFEVHDSNPSPGHYEVNQNWIKKHSCILAKDQSEVKNSHKTTKSMITNENANFILACPEILKELLEQKKREFKKSLQRPKYEVKKLPLEEHEKFYDTSPTWETKSFNVNFTHDLLPANNPLKNRNL